MAYHEKPELSGVSASPKREKLYEMASERDPPELGSKVQIAELPASREGGGFS